MSNYFIPLSLEQKNSLQEEPLGFCEMDIDGISGVVLEENDLRRFLVLIGATIAAQTQTSIEGIEIITLGWPAPTKEEIVEEAFDEEAEAAAEIERQKKLIEAARAKSREAYTQECSRRFEKTVRGTKDAVARDTKISLGSNKS